MPKSLKIAVLGGGHGCYAAAADMAEAGHEVRFWRRDAAALTPVIDAGVITLKDHAGTRPVPIALATADLAEAVHGADLLLSPLPALAQADVGVAMNTGTMTAKEAGNMVDLDSNPTKLIEIVAIGKQLLITRGALTTFSIANDVAKYFAIIPAMFAVTYPSLNRMNVMGLHTPQSAILAAVIFNALIIIVLVPLALRGVKYRPLSAGALLRRNLLVYGLGGVIVPFPAIWIIDRVLGLLRLA